MYLATQKGAFFTELLHFESLAVKFQRAAVLCYDANDIVWRTRWNFCVDLKCDFNLRAQDTGKVSNNLICDPTGVPADRRGIQGYSSVESLRAYPMCFANSFSV